MSQIKNRYFLRDWWAPSAINLQFHVVFSNLTSDFLAMWFPCDCVCKCKNTLTFKKVLTEIQDSSWIWLNKAGTE